MASADDGAPNTEQCPVCLEDLDGPPEAFPMAHDNALACPNGHHICFACAPRLLQPSLRKRKGTESGLMFRCPCCRAQCGLNPLHVLAVHAKSWDGVLKHFNCACELKAFWTNHPGCLCSGPGTRRRVRHRATMASARGERRDAPHA